LEKIKTKLHYKISIITVLLLTVLLFNLSFAFEDVPEEAWYYNDISSLQEQNLINGYENNLFKPNSNISNAEVLTIITRALVSEKSSKNNLEEKWYSQTLKKAYDIGVLQEKMTNEVAERNATREESAIYISNLIENFDKVKFENGYFKDTKSSQLNLLKELGIVNGSYNKGLLVFKPKEPITRAEISALVNRTLNKKEEIDKKVRGLLSKEEIETTKVIGPYLNPNIEDIKKPFTFEEFKRIFINMGIHNNNELTFYYDIEDYDKINTEEFKDNMSLAFDKVFSKYPEYFSFYNRASYNLKGDENGITSVIKIMNKELEQHTVVKIKTDFEKEVDIKIEKFLNTNYITEEMTQREKALKLYDWIVLNTVYDESLSGKYIYNGYGQIIEGEAVCQGYVATYNLMLKKLGINSIGITGYANGQPHVWTLAILDNKYAYIDPTWGDSYLDENKVNYDFFEIEEIKLKESHSWDLSQTDYFKSLKLIKETVSVQ
jgi:hypothetical protein